MEDLLHISNERFEFNRALAALKRGESPMLMSNVADGQKSHLLCYLQNGMELPFLYVARDEHEAAEVKSAAQAFFPDEVWYYPPRDLVYYPIEGRSYEWEHMRIRTIGAMQQGQARLVITTMGALMQFLPPAELLLESFFNLVPGQRIKQEELCRRLTDAGYVFAETIEGVGQFSRRGYLVDLFSPMHERPVRIEFFDDEIDTISTFDLNTQRRMEQLEQVQVAPVKEQMLGDEKAALALFESLKKRCKAGKRENKAEILEALERDEELVSQGGTLLGFDRYMPLLYQPESLLSYFPKGQYGLFISDYRAVRAAQEAVLEQNKQDVEQLLTQMVGYPKGQNFLFDGTELLRQAEGNPIAIAENFSNITFTLPVKSLIALQGKGLTPFSAADFLKEETAYYREKQYATVICCAAETRAKHVAELLAEADIIAPVKQELTELLPGTVQILVGGYRCNAEYETARLAVLCERGAEGGARRTQSGKGRRKQKKKDNTLFYSDLKPGDYVVHANYGIGRFVCVQKLEVEGTAKDYVKIAFAGSDTLFVPCNQLDLISKYVGSGDRQVKLSKMGGGDWSKTKSKVKAAVQEMAKELIELYASRQKLQGYAFGPDDDLQADFESRFPFEETDDQIRSAEEIKRDMERGVPMDRLLCGDVGFGKTEVAMRAIFKCVSGGKQAAVLVPTTLLAQQHYATMLERFEGYPIRIEVLSRFRTKKQQTAILKDVKKGLVDVVIGTHRLIQKDVEFKELGLLVVDEEQRFGVLHKERLKEMTKNVHCLTLSATPIPRTLNMAMSGIRDMSTIEEPPKDRQPVMTYVCAYHPGVIKDAIQKELRRGGQVFYLYNNIENIPLEAARIQQLVPQARVVYAHGKMEEGQIGEVMDRFLNREVDVLVCTTIIETGIDIQNANTLIITNADRLGLAQLYQIRGRVGRSNRRAYAYLTYNGNRLLSEDATKRLMAIKEYTEFGSGFQIAMRDLQIRGAGNILGTSQHGHMEVVGYDMYLKLLSEAVLEQQGQEREIPVSCTLDLFIDAYIPERYIASGETRIQIYKKIAALQNEEDALDIRDELIDRFGDIPESVNNLVEIALMRNRGSALGINEITQRGGTVYVYPTDMDMELITSLTAAYGKRIRFLNGAKSGFAVTKQAEQSGASVIKEVLTKMEQAVESV